MTQRTGRYASGVAAGLVLALTACVGTSRHEALEDVKTADGGADPTAQSALAKTLDRVSRVTSVRGTMASSSGVPPEQTEMKGLLVYRIKPPVAMRYSVPVARVHGENTEGFTELVTGGRFYMRIPYLRPKGAKPWSSVTLRAATRGSDVWVMSGGDPAFDLRLFTASEDVHPIGQETVRGMRTTHYQGTFELVSGLVRLSARRQAQARKSLAKEWPGTVDFDVWVDGRNLPRRFVIASPPGAKPRLRIVMDYTAFDIPVSLKPPPKDQVQEDPDLLLGAGGDDVAG